MGAPAVSVILPTHNRARVVARSVRSVLAQTFHDLELIVVDDGSTDDTEKMLAEFDDPRLVYLRLGTRSGVAAARNAGIRASRAPLLAFQDSDDEWLLGKLARQTNLLRELGEGCSLVCCGYIVIANDGRVRYQGADARMREGDWGPDNIYDFGFITPSWLVRRSALESVGLFDESLPNLEDWELAFRLFPMHRFVAIDEPLVVKHGGRDGLNAAREARIRSLDMISERYAHLWDQHPGVRARFYAEKGHLQCLIGETHKGQASFRQALLSNMTEGKYWMQYFAAGLGPSGYRRLLRMARPR